MALVLTRNTVEMQIKQDSAQQGTRGIRKYVGPVTVAVQVWIVASFFTLVPCPVYYKARPLW